MKTAELRRHQNAQIIELTRELRNDPEIWPIFQRVGFHDYMTRAEISFVLNRVAEVGHNRCRSGDLDIQSDDLKICVGLLERLGDGILIDADLEGRWVSDFIDDRWHTPKIGGRRTTKPVELGWIMSLAREIDSDPRNWKYFSSLTDLQYAIPSERPLPNPIDDRCVQFHVKHCLANRTFHFGIWELLFAKLERKWNENAVAIEDITDIEDVKKALSHRHHIEPRAYSGYNLDIYFEDLDR